MGQLQSCSDHLNHASTKHRYFRPNNLQHECLSKFRAPHNSWISKKGGSLKKKSTHMPIPVVILAFQPSMIRGSELEMLTLAPALEIDSK